MNFKSTLGSSNTQSRYIFINIILDTHTIFFFKISYNITVVILQSFIQYGIHFDIFFSYHREVSMCVVERGMIFLACTIDYFTKCSQLLNKALFVFMQQYFFLQLFTQILVVVVYVGKNELPLLGSCFKSFQENLIFQFLKYFCSNQCLIFLACIHDIQIIYPIIDWKSLVQLSPFCVCVFSTKTKIH